MILLDGGCALLAVAAIARWALCLATEDSRAQFELTEAATTSDQTQTGLNICCPCQTSISRLGDPCHVSYTWKHCLKSSDGDHVCLLSEDRDIAIHLRLITNLCPLKMLWWSALGCTFKHFTHNSLGAHPAIIWGRLLLFEGMQFHTTRLGANPIEVLLLESRSCLIAKEPIPPTRLRWLWFEANGEWTMPEFGPM